MTYLESWIRAASALFPQALSGEPAFGEAAPGAIDCASACISAHVKGQVSGRFLVLLPPGLLEAPLLGDAGDAKNAWIELLREVAETAAGDLVSCTGQQCRVESMEAEATLPEAVTRTFEIRAGERAWTLQVRDEVRGVPVSSGREGDCAGPESGRAGNRQSGGPGVPLLLDVELETTLRFGCRELQLGELLSLGPGDVVQLDRHISDPVDLIVGDKIVAHGEVVLVNGNFGLRVTEVAAPRERLESIRCLF